MDKGVPGDFLDCDTCPKPERRMLGCGWLRASDHLAGDRPFPEASVCPGYTTRFPEVQEAARALIWAKRGGVAPLYGSGQLPSVLIDAIDILDSARNDVEAETYREMRRDREGG
jgi:hypothetical protein